MSIWPKTAKPVIKNNFIRRPRLKMMMLESQKFFDTNLAPIADARHMAQQNALCMNSKVRQKVADMCTAHNDSLVDKTTRKRKSSEKISSGSSTHSQEPKKKSKKVST